jgi:hypothetical protein
MVSKVKPKPKPKPTVKSYFTPKFKKTLLAFSIAYGIPVSVLLTYYALKPKSDEQILYDSIKDLWNIKDKKTKEELKKHCNKLYLEFHPDKNGNAETFDKIRTLCKHKESTFV